MRGQPGLIRIWEDFQKYIIHKAASIGLQKMRMGE